MAIAIPGRRLALRCAPRFVARMVARTPTRATNASLSLTSMIDFLIVVVVFLLMTFSASAQTSASDVPAAQNVSDLVDAPIVAIARGQVILDGVVLGDTQAIELTARVGVLDGLTAALGAKRRTWLELHPGRAAPATVVLQIDRDTPAVVVKSLFVTATRAGYPNISLMVQALRN